MRKAALGILPGLAMTSAAKVQQLTSLIKSGSPAERRARSRCSERSEPPNHATRSASTSTNCRRPDRAGASGRSRRGGAGRCAPALTAASTHSARQGRGHADAWPCVTRCAPAETPGAERGGLHEPGSRVHPLPLVRRHGRERGAEPLEDRRDPVARPAGRGAARAERTDCARVRHGGRLALRCRRYGAILKPKEIRDIVEFLSVMKGSGADK